MEKWRRQTFIVALCFAAVLAARMYVKKTLGEPQIEESTAGEVSLNPSEEGTLDSLGPADGSVVSLKAEEQP